jgi:hypothetical protein
MIGPMAVAWVKVSGYARRTGPASTVAGRTEREPRAAADGDSAGKVTSLHGSL